MEDISEILPITAFIAIIIFVIKEVLETSRRSNGTKRSVSAIKELLKDELNENITAFHNLFACINEDQDDDIYPGALEELKTMHEGEFYYNRSYQDGRLISGRPLPAFQFGKFTKFAPYLAENSRKFYKKLKSSYEGIYTCRHLRDSFINYVLFDAEKIEGEFSVFREYARSQRQDIIADLDTLSYLVVGKAINEKPPPIINK